MRRGVPQVRESVPGDAQAYRCIRHIREVTLPAVRRAGSVSDWRKELRSLTRSFKHAESMGPLVPKLCLGTHSAKLCFACPTLASDASRETEFRPIGSQTEFGNQNPCILETTGKGAEVVPLPYGRGSARRLRFSLAAGLLEEITGAEHHDPDGGQRQRRAQVHRSFRRQVAGDGQRQEDQADDLEQTTEFV